MGEIPAIELKMDTGELIVNVNLNFEYERQFAASCDELMESKAENLTIDIRAAQFMCSSSLGMLIMMADMVKKSDRSLKVIVSQKVHPTLELMGVAKFLSELEVI